MRGYTFCSRSADFSPISSILDTTSPCHRISLMTDNEISPPGDSSNRWNRKQTSFIFIAIGFWLLLRVIKLLLFNDLTNDEGNFLNFAEAVTKGHFNLPIFDGFARISEYIFYIGILQGPLLALFLKIFGMGSWFWSPKVETLLFATILLWFLARYASNRRWPTGHVVLFLALAAFDPFIWTVTDWSRPDIPQIFFYSASLFLLWDAIENPRPRVAFAAGICGGLSMLFSWGALSILPAAFCAIVFCSRDIKSLLKNGIFYFVAAAAVLAPFFIWVLSSKTRTDIFILQLSYGSDVASKASAHLSMFRFLLGFGAREIVRSFLTLSSLTFYVLGSPGAWIFLSIIIYSLIHIRDRESRFWLLAVVVALLVASTSSEIKGYRVMMLLPPAYFRFLSVFRSDFRGWRRSAAIASLFVSLLALYGYLSAHAIAVGPFHLRRFDMFSQWNYGVFAAVVFLAFFLVTSIASCLRKRPSAPSAAIVALACLALLFVFRGVEDMSATPGFFYPRNLAPLRRQIDMRFGGTKPIRAVTSAEYYPLFPPNCRVFASALFRFYMNYQYWPNYRAFTDEIHPDRILLTAPELQAWKDNPYSREYLDTQFKGTDRFTVGGREFFVFSKK